ncbi:ALK and LTK ligand 2b isoform X2 [Mastacembelus armatus]|uniref:ALK and LTK ligand 2b isoform X2 n=1 Tax=Mastacembelus armatus TaxID=205130 RepID=UPI000E460F95|nr:ALK and LTK ligand 2-like isoform X2 [Mastacembelus armatus]
MLKLQQTNEVRIVMLPLRLPVLSALLLLLLVAGRCTLRTSLRGSQADRSVDALEQAAELTAHGGQTLERQSRSRHGVEPKDTQHKERFIKHLTGPLYFNPKCRKHFHRLYHTTRDCTIPAYYKRCARLLTRLASSPRCAER